MSTTDQLNPTYCMSHPHYLCSLYVLPRFTLITGYYGISLNSAQLSADPYISCFISGAVEVPAYICCWLVMKYLPRRPSAICTILVGGVSLFFIQLVPQSKKRKSPQLEAEAVSSDLSHDNSKFSVHN